MLFNSIDFAIFLPIVFIAYWGVLKKHLKAQNIFLLVVSYVFYGWWDYRFLTLIAFSTCVDFIIAKQLYRTTKTKFKNMLLGLSLTVNLGLLGVFKYYNFFVESWVTAWGHFGVNMSSTTLNIILPVGISFYTFQTLSYTIDVYRNKITPSNSFIEFAAFVSFFPQLVAGPIERASNLLPQFSKSRVFSYEQALSGFYLIVWGLFKKVVVADNCAFFVDQIFDASSSYSSAELLLGAVLFAFQIYGDFSGYSDIAIGVARLFGFTLMTNFKFPYFSRDVAEFWRRWHISLSTWFRDYLYIPIGGSKGSTWQQFRNVMIVFLVSGFWHGANVTFIAWGALHAILFLPLLFTNTNRTYTQTTQFKLGHLPKIVLTFFIVTIAWIFFRANTITDAFGIIIDIFRMHEFTLDLFVKSSKNILYSAIIICSILILFLFEYTAVQHNKKEVQLSIYTSVFVGLLICFMGVFKNPSDFIYFQF